jgi:hypothetical protein
MAILFLMIAKLIGFRFWINNELQIYKTVKGSGRLSFVQK